MGYNSVALGVKLVDDFASLLCLIAKTIINRHGQTVQLSDMYDNCGEWIDDEFTVVEFYDDIEFDKSDPDDTEEVDRSFNPAESSDDKYEWPASKNFHYKFNPTICIGDPQSSGLKIYLNDVTYMSDEDSDTRYNFQTLTDMMNWIKVLRQTPATLSTNHHRLPESKDNFLEVIPGY